MLKNFNNFEKKKFNKIIKMLINSNFFKNLKNFNRFRKILINMEKFLLF